jgi:DNA topoisomerase-1
VLIRGQKKVFASKNFAYSIAVAKILGNTPAICRKCYVHPAIFETYLDGDSIEGLKQKTEEAISKISTIYDRVRSRF